MTERDMIFLIGIVITASTLVVFITQWWRGRGGKDD